MSLSTLASKVAKIEGLKHQASIGDIREIIKAITIIFASEIENDETEGELVNFLQFIADVVGGAKGAKKAAISFEICFDVPKNKSLKKKAKTKTKGKK